jgi:hypothetical protein
MDARWILIMMSENVLIDAWQSRRMPAARVETTAGNAVANSITLTFARAVGAPARGNHRKLQFIT